MKLKKIALAVGLGLVFAQVAYAAPGLDITNGPVVNSGDTGPNVPAVQGNPGVQDPSAASGQWFQNTSNGLYSSRPYQFYDNATGSGGGTAGTNAIRGYISSFSYNIGGQVTGFQITASVTNDMQGLTGWADGTNAHGETLSTTQQLPQMTMHHTVLSTLFADDGTQGNFPVGGANIGPESNIYAIGYDSAAWYSYTNTGAFWVPTWNFGNIGIGQTATRVLDFGLYSAVDAAFFVGLYDPGVPIDVFTSQSNNLKLGNYFSPLAADTGAALQTSDVAVFFTTPEPASLALLGLAGLAGITARRRQV
jgi:hypothetical protein